MYDPKTNKLKKLHKLFAKLRKSDNKAAGKAKHEAGTIEKQIKSGERKPTQYD